MIKGEPFCGLFSKQSIAKGSPFRVQLSNNDGSLAKPSFRRTSASKA